MKWKDFRRIAIVLLAGGALFLAGCDDDNGDNGPAGRPGESVGEAVARPGLTILPAEVTAASVAEGGRPSVSFVLRDENGQPINLTQEDLSSRRLGFTLAKLVPGETEGTYNWRSYINRVETAAAGVGPGGQQTPPARALQADIETGGTLTNNGDGSYTYTFATDLNAVTDPVTNQPIAFDPALTHRVGIEFSQAAEGTARRTANATFDFVPAGGTPVQYTVSNTASCNECHDVLTAHGGRRINVDHCVTCHNPFTVDANSGNTVDMPVMVHKIHHGRELPSVQAGQEYILWGFGNQPHNYSDIGYPQDIRYCTKCHETSEATPQGNNWRTAPSIAACGSCHDDVLFNPAVQGITGTAPAWMHPHPAAFPVNDAQCVACHPAEGTGAGGSVTAAHFIPADAASANFRYNILGTSFDQGTRVLTVRFSVSNPNSGGALYDIKADPAFTTGGGVATLNVLVGWTPQEFHNTGSGRNPAQPLSINALTAATANGDGTFSVVSSPIPAGVETVGVAVEGHPAAADAGGTFNLRVPVRNAFTTVALAGGEAPGRRQVVSIDKCNVCHNILTFHGNNRTNNIEVCTMCHNPNATDVARRPTTAPTGTADNKTEESIDFKTMIHAIHGNDIRQNGVVLWGFAVPPATGTQHDFGIPSTTGEEVFYPGLIQNCRKCHVEQSYRLPLQNYVLATTIRTGANRAIPTDDVNITPASAVCSSCHDSPEAINHMRQNGGRFDLVGNQTAGEVNEPCAGCHAGSGPAPVETVHGVFDVPVPAPEPVPGTGILPGTPLPREPEQPPGEEPPPTEPPTVPPPTEPPPVTPPTEPPPVTPPTEPPPVTPPTEPPPVTPPTEPPPVTPPTEPPPVTPPVTPPTEPPPVTPPTQPPPTGPDLGLGQAVYDMRCSSCHALGSYDPAGFAPNLSNRGEAVPVAFPTPGAPGIGVHAGIVLSAEEIAAVTGFVESR